MRVRSARVPLPSPMVSPMFRLFAFAGSLIQVLYRETGERRSAKIYALKRTVNLSYLLATAATGQVAFCHFRGYARLLRVRHFHPKLPYHLLQYADILPIARRYAARF